MRSPISGASARSRRCCAALDERAGEAAVEALAEIAARHRAGGQILFRAAAWIVTAKAETS